MIDVLLNRESNYRSDMTHGNKIDEQKTKVKKVYANYISLEDVTCILFTFEDHVWQPNATA